MFHAAVRVVARHARALVALGQRDRAHVAVEVKTPGVVGADESAAHVALQITDQLHAAMRTPVVQHLHAAIGLAHHDHRLAADRHRVVVTSRGHLRLVAAINPGALPDLFHLGIEDRLVGVNALVHAVGFDELLHVHASLLSPQIEAINFSSAWPLSSASAAALRSRSYCAPFDCAASRGATAIRRW
jgi:hypothetical protein